MINIDRLIYYFFSYEQDSNLNLLARSLPHQLLSSLEVWYSFTIRPVWRRSYTHVCFSFVTRYAISRVQCARKTLPAHSKGWKATNFALTSLSASPASPLPLSPTSHHFHFIWNLFYCLNKKSDIQNFPVGCAEVVLSNKSQYVIIAFCWFLPGGGVPSFFIPSLLRFRLPHFHDKLAPIIVCQLFLVNFFLCSIIVIAVCCAVLIALVET